MNGLMYGWVDMNEWIDGLINTCSYSSSSTGDESTLSPRLMDKNVNECMYMCLRV